MKAIILENYNPNLVRALRSLKIVEKKIQHPVSDQVLIKVDAAPCNPSDIAFLRGMYMIKKTLPATPGFEGTGKVVSTGENTDAKKLIGKRVSFFSQESGDGSWAEYCIGKVSDYILINEKLPVEQAATIFINPFTAYAIFKTIIDTGFKSLIQSAAMGQVGCFLRYFAKEAGIEVINLVKKDAHVKQLKHEGNKFVLNIRNENFEKSITRLANDLNARLAIDAVGGELTGIMLNAMPPGSDVILYGGLSGMPVTNIDTLGIIFNKKRIRGFNINDWIKETDRKDFEKISEKIQKLFIEGKLKSKVQKIVNIDNFYEGLRTYISNMSGGKVLINF